GLSLGNTQGNDVFGLDINVGTDGINSQGIRVYGTGSQGTDGHGHHLTLWGNTVNSPNKVLSVGNGTSFSENLNIRANGQIVITQGISSDDDSIIITNLVNSGNVVSITANG